MQRVYRCRTGPAIAVASRVMTTSPAEFPRSPRAPWLLPLGLAVMVLAGLVAVVFFANRAAQPDMPPAAGPVLPPAGLPYQAFDVERNAEGILRLSSGGGAAVDVTVDSSTRVWVLEPASLEDIQAPVVVNVIAVPNEVRNFAIRVLAFGLPGEGGETNGEEFIPLADGFAGHEVSADGAERAVLSGVVRSIDGNILNVLLNGGGNSTIEIDPGAPIRVLREGGPADIRPGDRVALHRDADGTIDPAQGILVLPPE